MSRSSSARTRRVRSPGTRTSVRSVSRWFFEDRLGHLSRRPRSMQRLRTSTTSSITSPPTRKPISRAPTSVPACRTLLTSRSTTVTTPRFRSACRSHRPRGRREEGAQPREGTRPVANHVLSESPGHDPSRDRDRGFGMDRGGPGRIGRKPSADVRPLSAPRPRPGLPLEHDRSLSYFSAKLALETDASDVYAAQKAGEHFVLVDVRGDDAWEQGRITAQSTCPTGRSRSGLPSSSIRRFRSSCTAGAPAATPRQRELSSSRSSATASGR